jgi:hypothetical protein
MRRIASVLLSAFGLLGVVIVAACADDKATVESEATSDSGASNEASTGSPDSSSEPASDSSTADSSSDGAKPTTGGPFSFTGQASTAPTAGSKVIVIWTVSSGSPDYSYEFGAGSTAGTDVIVTFTNDPPAEALNDGKLGVGLVAVVDADANIPEGKVTSGQLSGVKFISVDHAVIFRSSPDTVLKNGWDAMFPQGWSCGACERHDSGFDTYKSVDCSTVTLVPFDASADFCNWT